MLRDSLKSKTKFRQRAAASLLVTLASTMAPAMTFAATPEELEKQVQALAQQLQALQTELAQLKAQQAAAPQVAATGSTPPPQPAATINTETSPLSFFGYGELNYSRPRDDTSQTSADMARFVLGVGYQFDERTHFVSELELEHAVSSADDPGEIEVEQAYIDHRLTDGVYAKAGLFLIPSGLLNENHEPTRYYGVFRNYVETAIIPTTWREGGAAIQGNTASGLRWDAGITTGFNLSKWDATSSEGLESPLGAIHQELAQANAKDLSWFAALNYTGVPGLRLGASVFNGGVSQGQAGWGNSHLTLWESHARWTPGAFDLSGLYAHGHLSDTQTINTTLVGNPTLVPEDFFGWYLQAAYRVWDSGSYNFAPFVRYERFNTASSYEELAAGLTPSVAPDQKIWTTGFNLGIARGVVLKADYLWFRDSGNSDRFDLGVGYQF